MKNNTVNRESLSGDAVFRVRNLGEEADAAAARLRMHFAGVDVQILNDGRIIMARGDYADTWAAITETDVAQVVQRSTLLHIVLAPDPTVIDSISMRVNILLGPPHTQALSQLGLTASPILTSGGLPGFRYRLTPQVGNPWPSRDEIAKALDATHSEPMNPEAW